MRLIATTALLLCLSITGCHTHQKCDHCKDRPAMTEPTQSLGVYRHVVAFRFKDSTTDAQIEQIIEDFAGLQKDIPEIIAFEHGKNVSPEGLDQGFTHVFLVTF
ncbi:MAG: Dabb family protein, partial [Phycisphaeraceae bacterium]